MDEFINEVDEQLKEEKLIKLWRQYGNYLIAGILTVVITTAGFVGWKNYKQNARESESLAFFEAMKTLAVDKNYAGSIAKLKSLSDNSNYFRGLAKFREIVVMIEEANINKKPEEETIIPKDVSVLYKQIMDDKKIDSKLRDLASLSYVLIEMDKADPKEMIKILQAQEVDTNPWSLFSKELIAFLALKAGDKPLAKKMYDELSKIHTDLNKSGAVSNTMAQRLYVLKSAISN